MSVKKDGAGIRKERINILIDIIEKNPEITENKVKGIFMLKTGLTKRAIEGYLEELILFEILKREGDRLSTLF